MINLNIDSLQNIRIVCDLDDTICYPNLSETNSALRYAKAEPNHSLIKKLVGWKREGAYIIIYTARRMKTHNGNLEKILEDVKELTEQWLKVNKVPYDELVFGKPYGDVYIDDKALNVINL